MIDTVTPEKRSQMMRGIRGRDTRPELLVRSIAHRLGLRFRLHYRSLPGRPDLAFPKHKLAVFVQGCFWHRHQCALAASPKTHVEFWQDKFAENVARDAKNHKLIRESGWVVLEVWECETKNPDLVRQLLEEAIRLCPHEEKG